MPWIEQNSGGASPTIQISVVGDPTTSAIVITRTEPAVGTLDSWDLEYKLATDTEWTSYATGITAETQTVADLDAATSYDFRALGHVSMETEYATTSATTADEPPPSPIPLTLWSQIEGGQQFGNQITGGGITGWNNSGDLTTQADPRNDEAENIVAAQGIFEMATASMHGPWRGFAIRAQNVWSIDSTEIPGQSGGSIASPKIVLTPELPLAQPWLPGQRALYQQCNGAGPLCPGTALSNNGFPQSGLITSVRSDMGNILGTPGTVANLYSPWASRIYVKRAANEHYVFAIFGDSTTVPVRPTAAPNSLAREGWHFRANIALRTAGKKVRAYSYGQGAANWPSILSRARANLPHLAGKVSRALVLFWTWNSAWSNSGQVDTAWAEYLALEAEFEAAGIACSPMILNPYTTRTGVGQPEAFASSRAYVVAHARGIVLDDIMGDSSWPNLPTLESQDNVHQNDVGAVRTGPLAATRLLAVAVADHPELA